MNTNNEKFYDCEITLNAQKKNINFQKIED